MSWDEKLARGAYLITIVLVGAGVLTGIAWALVNAFWWGMRG